MQQTLRQLLVVARREFKERVLTKWYVFGMIIGPLGLLAMIIIPAVLAAQSPPPKVLVVGTGEVVEAVALALRGESWQVETAAPSAELSESVLLTRIQQKEIDGYLTVPVDVIDGGEVIYRGANATSMVVSAQLTTQTSLVVVAARALKYGLTRDQIEGLQRPIKVSTLQTTGEPGQSGSGDAARMVGLAAMMLIFYAIIFFAVNVLRGVVEEKTSRVAEVMAATCRPAALLGGKILGVGVAGLLQLAGWVAVALIVLHFRGAIVMLITGKAAGDVALPHIGAAAITVVAAYFLLGYFFYAALYAAVGAMVSSEQEAQQAQTPIMLALTTGMLAFQMVASDPRSSASQILTMVPFTSPLLMPMRYLVGGAEWPDIVLSLLLLLAATVLVTWAAHRIYRVGMLSYGKKPTWRQLLAWIRTG